MVQRRRRWKSLALAQQGDNVAAERKVSQSELDELALKMLKILEPYDGKTDLRCIIIFRAGDNTGVSGNVFPGMVPMALRQVADEYEQNPEPIVQVAPSTLKN
jgi:hypothetical protein